MLPWARLRSVALGGGERVPLLDEAIDLVVGAGLRLNVEVKGDVPRRRASARAVAGVLSRRSASEREAIVLSTFDPLVLLSLKRCARGVPVAFLFDRAHTGAIKSAWLRRILRPDGLHPHEPLVTAGQLARWKRRGLFVTPWTVNDPQRARWLASLGVDGLITDDVPALRAGLEGRE
jgi:glycerophosphoryl diester phosphodiesterase